MPQIAENVGWLLKIVLRMAPKPTKWEGMPLPHPPCHIAPTLYTTHYMFVYT